MNPLSIAKRRPFITATLLIAVVAGATIGLGEMRADSASPKGHPQMIPSLDDVSAKVEQMKGYITDKFESYSEPDEEPSHEEEHDKIVVISPVAKDVTITEPYVCQIHSQRHIEVRAIESGYLQEILVREGQTVKQGDLMFRIVPTLYQARLDAENAEAQLAQLEFNNTKKLFEQRVVSQNEVALIQAKLAKAQAKAKLAAAELNFTYVRAPFDGIVDRLEKQLGSLIAEGDELTTLSDNSVMWVYFNVSETRYLEYMASSEQEKAGEQIELVLANGSTFPQRGKIGAIEAKFNNENGNIAFRADFPNPARLLRHGQTGTVQIHRVIHNALVIPQRATFEILDKRYVYLVDKDNVVHQREIGIQNELEDVFVLKAGLAVDDRIVFEGIRQVHDGEKVAYEFRSPDQVMGHLKNEAE